MTEYKEIIEIGDYAHTYILYKKGKSFFIMEVGDDVYDSGEVTWKKEPISRDKVMEYLVFRVNCLSVDELINLHDAGLLIDFIKEIRND